MVECSAGFVIFLKILFCLGFFSVLLVTWYNTYFKQIWVLIHFFFSRTYLVVRYQRQSAVSIDLHIYLCLFQGYYHVYVLRFLSLPLSLSVSLSLSLLFSSSLSIIFFFLSVSATIALYPPLFTLFMTTLFHPQTAYDTGTKSLVCVSICWK